MSKSANQTPVDAAAEAAALVKRTAEETATALNIQYMQKDIAEIKATVKELANKDGVYVQKDEFVFWRNLLVSGILLTIALGVVVNLVASAIK